MNDEDRKFLQSVKNMTPSSEIFKRLVQILAAEQEKTDQLLLDEQTKY